MGSSEDAVKAAAKGIHASLVPLIFRRWDLDKLNRPILNKHLLPKTAEILCKFSGLLVQAYWFMLKSQKKEHEIPDQLEAILQHIWAGHQKYRTGISISLLHEASLANQSSSISQLVREPEVFVKWSEFLNSRERRLKAFINDSESLDRYVMFARLIQALPVLKNTVYDGENFIFGQHSVPTFPFIASTEEVENALYLYSFEQIKTSPKILFEDPYSDYTEECELEDSEIAKEKYNFVRKTLGFENVPEGMLYLFGSGYDHIKNLALAIANAPGAKCEEALAKLIEDYPDNFEEYRPGRGKVDFVVLLLAERGPIEIMNRLLKYEPSLLDEYLAFFEARGQGKASIWKKKIKDMANLRKKSIDGYLDLDKDLKREVSDNIESESKCWGILRSAGLKIDSPHPYVESIDMRILMVKEWGKRLRSNRYSISDVGLKIEKLLERTLRFLVCFYAGLEGYYLALCRKTATYDLYEESMLEAARQQYLRISRASPGVLVDELKRLARDCSREVTDTLLGRRETCNRVKLDELTQGDYLGVLNRLKHDKKTEVSKAEMINFVEKTCRLFGFLKCGQVLNHDELVGFPLEPIYPMVISFREAHRKRDGLLIYNYEIYSPGEKSSEPIRILTSREYVPDEEYYCIPLYNRSTINWWLDPFLIRCSKFDEIVS